MDEQNEAFVEVNHPNIAVRMRRPRLKYSEWAALILSNAGAALGACKVAILNASYAPPTRYATRPRLSGSDTHHACYFEIRNCEDSNAIADKLKAALIELGYTLTKERFSV